MVQNNKNYGVLYVVATPIGNLDDITIRAIDTLRKADLIAAEDTRHTVKLLNHFGIKKRMISYHEYSNASREKEIIETLKQGLNVALVSDAGTPLVSDPGYRLVKKCIEEGITLESIPGPCAAITAASISGIDLKRFIFAGFLENKSAVRKRELLKLYECKLPVILYESPNRVLKTIEGIIEIWGKDIAVCAARELTKIYEETIRGSAEEVKEILSEKSDIRGEFVIIVEAPQNVIRTTDKEVIEALKYEIAQGRSKKESAREVANRTGRPKNEIYKLSLTLDKE